MYSIERGLGKKWKPLAVAFAMFAVISSFGSGNAVQSFTVADQFRQDLGVPTWVTGLVLASLVAAVILGGTSRHETARPRRHPSARASRLTISRKTITSVSRAGIRWISASAACSCRRLCAI